MQANLKSHKDDKDLGLENSFVTASLELHKVSGKLEGVHELQKPHFQLYQPFHIYYSSLIITPSGEIIGSVIQYDQNEG